MGYNYIGLDLETSGSDHDLHVPIQIGVALQTGEVFDSLIGGWDWDAYAWTEESFQIHQITREAVDGAPPAFDVDMALEAWLGDNAGPGTKVMVGWGVGTFDAPYVRKWLPRTASTFIRRYLDLNAACYVLEKPGARNPDTLRRQAKAYANERVEARGATAGRHDAAFDAQCALYELEYLRNKA